MPSRKAPEHDATPGPTERPPAAFHDAGRTASALRRAVTAVYDAHGEAGGAEVLAPLLEELARAAAGRGIDVEALIAQALSAPAEARTPAATAKEPKRPERRRNARLFHALTRACIELLELSRSERDQDAMSEELFRLMLAAGVYEDLSASPRDPDRHLTAAVPRDAVLSLMYLLASRRQFAEEFFLRHEQTELREHLVDDLQRGAERLRELGCEVDVDTSMAFAIALWTPDERQAAEGRKGVCFTFGRSALDSHAADFVVRFEATGKAAAMRAADALYFAHLVQRRRPRDEYIDLHGVLFEPHLLHRGELAEAFGDTPIDPAQLRALAPRIATLSYAGAATARTQRARFIPVGEGDALHVGPGRATRH